jgi:hypothetical protein
MSTLHTISCRSLMTALLSLLLTGGFDCLAESETEQSAPTAVQASIAKKRPTSPVLQEDPVAGSTEAQWKRDEVMQRALGRGPAKDRTNEYAMFVGVPLLLVIAIAAILQLRAF